MKQPGFNICLSPDSVLLKDYIDEQLNAFPAPSGQSREKRVFWGDEPLGAPFWETLVLQGLFQRPRAVILRNAQNLPAESLKKLSQALGSADSQVWPFICFEIEPDKGRFKLPAHVEKLQCCVFARKQGWLKEIPPLDGRGLKDYIRKETARLGLTLTPDSLEALAAGLPPDAGAARLELEKIALACPAAVITAEALAELDYSKDIDIFSFLQTLQSGRNPERVWRQFMKDNQLSADSGLFGFLAMLLREARTLWQLLAGEQVFLPGAVIGPKTALARGLGFGSLARIWDLALQAEKGVKTGERNPQQAFERLLAELFSLFRRQ